jgi:hypothetical protein
MDVAEQKIERKTGASPAKGHAGTKPPQGSDRYAVPHLWVLQELRFVTADWQSHRVSLDEGTFVTPKSLK